MQRCSPRCRRQSRSCPRSWVTSDDSLWSELGAIDNDWVPKQLDSVDELVASFPAGLPGVVMWDARAQPAPAAMLSRLQLHSDRLAVIVLDSPENAASWARAIEKRQVAAHVSLPIVADTLERCTEARPRGNRRPCRPAGRRQDADRSLPGRRKQKGRRW